LDTETLIEEAVSGYQTKITNLQAQVTKYEWKQEAYQNIITPMYNFSQKYTSYSSSTNLTSNTFFNNATKVTTSGTYKDLISASGRTSSDVAITQVSQLATAARYNGLGDALNSKDADAAVTGDAFEISGKMSVGKLTGSMSLTYGDQRLYLSFSEDDVFETAQDMADWINEKLADLSVSYSNGNNETASNVVKAVASKDGTSISIQTVDSDDRNSVWISSASSDVKDALGISPSSSDQSLTSFTFDKSKVMTETEDTINYLSQKGFTITVDGTTKTVYGPTETELEQEYGKDWTSDDYVDMLQKKINAKFGPDTLTVSNGYNPLTTQVSGADSTGDNAAVAAGEDADAADTSVASTAKMLQLSFQVQEGSTLLVTSSAGESVGISGSLTNYVDTSNTLGDLMDLTATDADGNALYETKKNEDGTVAKDTDGNTIYTVTINDVDFDVTEKTTLSSLMSSINSNDDVGLSVSYSKTSKTFSFTANDTGSGGSISMDNNLAEALFGKTVSEIKDKDGNVTNADKVTVTAGKNAIFTAVVNGKTMENLERSSNSVDLDGMTVKLKGTFDTTTDDTATAVTFDITSDTDTIVSAIKSMIADYNTIISAVKSAYTTTPAQKSDGSSYEPLSEDDEADMSDTAIENYEKKAKQGLLFMDSDLSSLYNALRNCFNSASLKSIGISTSYSDGLTTVSLDENTLIQALEDDPDSVRDLFTSSTNSGGSYDGLMTKLDTVFDRYVSTTGSTKGILIEKSGATQSSSSLTSNTWYTAIQNLEDQIEKWQDKLSDKVDYYTTKFTNLETVISEMNSQSSMLSSLTGGY
jgi:flagellar hook-associated protein 2